MAITPAPGYMIDPNNPNGVIPIAGQGAANNPNYAYATVTPAGTPAPTSGAAGAADQQTAAISAASTPAPTNTQTTQTSSPAPTSQFGNGDIAPPVDLSNVPLDSTVQIDGKWYTYQNYQGEGNVLRPYSQASPGMPTPTSTPYVFSTTGNNTAPAVTSIDNPTAAPTSTSGSISLPAATAPSSADTYNTSLSATVASQQQQLDAAYQAQAANYQTQIDALKQQASDQQALQASGLASEQSLIGQETAQKQAALDAEMKQFQDNYNARQQLVGQLSTLLTTGQSIIEGMKNTTGLASIMNPRLSQTMSDVQAQAGVITAALAAYDSQIGIAQNQLQSATAAISSIYSDQINYWQNVLSFYNDQQKITDTQIANLSADQKTYIDAQINQLQSQLNQTQATSKAISQAMLDPSTALAYAKAGVTLNDTPEAIAQKLAAYEQAQQNVWSAPTLVGGDYIQTNKLTGETRTVVSNVQPTTVTTTTSGGGTTPGSSTTTGGGTTGSNTTTTTTTVGAGTTNTLSGVQGGKTFVSGSLQVTPDQYNQTVNILHSTTTKDANGNPNMGPDGYTNPAVYLQALAAWNQAGGSTADFLTLYPIKKYINPANTWPQITALGGGTKTKTASTSGSGAQLP